MEKNIAKLFKKETIERSFNKIKITLASSDKIKSWSFGEIKKPINPLLLGLDAGASFVARGFAGEVDHLKEVIKQAIQYRGFSHVDILQPCVTFNKVNTYEWFKKVAYKLEDHRYKPDDKVKARQKAEEFELDGKMPIGVIYKEERKTYGDQLPQLKGKALGKRY